jgi:hypothetical protein
MSTATAASTKSAAPTTAARPTAHSAAGGGMGKKPTYNLFTGIGRLGREPELRYSADGRAWCKTSLAIFQGEGKEPIWLDLKAFAQPLDAGGWDESVPLALAELKKGQKISVRGKLYCDKRDYNGKEYVDWGLVLYHAPVVVTDTKADDGEPD